jgi:4-amino-4-deoxy-L-arabinose transferase-like glycosyltransferase
MSTPDPAKSLHPSSPAATDVPQRLSGHEGATHPIEESPESTPAGIFKPEGSSGERKLVAVIALVSFAYLLLFRRYTTMDPDEGIILQGAQRILQGEVLYRDFFSFFTPGSYYLVALLFKVFGSSMLVARTALAVYGSLFSALTYLLARRVCSRWSALLAACFVTLTCMPFRFIVLHNWDSTLWACLALYCALRTLESGHWGWALGLGCFSALTLLFEQSKGAGLIMGLALAYALIALTDRGRTIFRRGQWLALAVGVAWPISVTLIYFTLRHALSPMVADCLWPIYHYSGVNQVPYGYQNWPDSMRATLLFQANWSQRLVSLLVLAPCFIMPVLPLVAMGFLAYGCALGRKHNPGAEVGTYYLVVGSVLSGLLVSVVIVRSDIIHFMYLSPLLLLVLAWIMDGRDVHSALFRAARPVLNFLLLASFVAFGLALFLRTMDAPYKIGTRRGALKAPQPDTVVAYIQAHVTPGERILVYPYLPLYYYLTGTFSPIRYEYLMPGMHTEAQVHDVLDQLASRPPCGVVFELNFYGKIANPWPRTPLRSIAYDPVGDWLVRHYHTCAVLRSPDGWRFLYMAPKGQACP